jgi:hypothetical protein
MLDVVVVFGDGDGDGGQCQWQRFYCIYRIYSYLSRDDACGDREMGQNTPRLYRQTGE